MKVRVSSYRTKGHVMTKTQKLAKAETRARVARKNQTTTSPGSKGIGSYARKANKPLSRRQAYKLERMALQNERAQVNSKPEMVKAIGQSLALNTAPQTTTFAATAGTSKMLDSTSRATEANLIDSGAKRANTNNEEEEAEILASGGYLVR